MYRQSHTASTTTTKKSSEFLCCLQTPKWKSWLSGWWWWFNNWIRDFSERLERDKLSLPSPHQWRLSKKSLSERVLSIYRIYLHLRFSSLQDGRRTFLLFITYLVSDSLLQVPTHPKLTRGLSTDTQHMCATAWIRQRISIEPGSPC